MRPVRQSIAERAESARPAVRHSRKAFEVVAGSGDAYSEIGVAECPCVLIERRLEVSPQVRQIAVAGVESVQLGVEVGEGAGKQEAQDEGFVQAVAQVELAQRLAQEPPVEVFEARDFVVGDDSLPRFEEVHEGGLAGEVAALEREESLSRLVGFVAGLFQLGVGGARGEELVRGGEEVAEQIRRRGGVPGGVVGERLPQLRGEVLPGVAQAAAHSSP